MDSSGPWSNTVEMVIILDPRRIFWAFPPVFLVAGHSLNLGLEGGLINPSTTPRPAPPLHRP